ncbi:hypothetical protein CALCODRAFT_202713 [Calocera cornea HHB12733]|uniref:Secreted protein n=1 Tax=Calocera cornea HHB12733 TaxID=1353952 RepID=A0A165JY94_9BASI|nr:hypothetical protein CALCODRAFT_202713 [Calocera cornea HHB12733]
MFQILISCSHALMLSCSDQCAGFSYLAPCAPSPGIPFYYRRIQHTQHTQYVNTRVQGRLGTVRPGGRPPRRVRGGAAGASTLFSFIPSPCFPYPTITFRSRSDAVRHRGHNRVAFA